MFSDGYIWMDYLSIPQLDQRSQGLAIQSITEYVSHSNLFIVLAGAWTHVDDGSIRDLQAWGERGWCRMENLANSLSPALKTFIVAQSPTNIYAYGPMGIVGRFWFWEVVGHGVFTVEADKAALGPAILALIETRKAKLNATVTWSSPACSLQSPTDCSVGRASPFRSCHSLSGSHRCASRVCMTTRIARVSRRCASPSSPTARTWCESSSTRSGHRDPLQAAKEHAEHCDAGRDDAGNGRVVGRRRGEGS